MTQTERYAEVDAMAEHAQQFNPIQSSIPDPRPPVRYVPKHILGYSFSHGRAFNDLDVSVALARLQESGALTEEQCELIDEASIKACQARMDNEGRSA